MGEDGSSVPQDQLDKVRNALENKIDTINTLIREYEKAHNFQISELKESIIARDNQCVQTTTVIHNKINKLKELWKPSIGLENSIMWQKVDDLQEKINGMSNGCSLAQQNLNQLNELKEALTTTHLENFERILLNKEVLQKHIEEHINIAEADRDDEDIIAKWKRVNKRLLEKLDVGSARQTVKCIECRTPYTGKYPLIPNIDWVCEKCYKTEKKGECNYLTKDDDDFCSYYNKALGGEKIEDDIIIGTPLIKAISNSNSKPPEPKIECSELEMAHLTREDDVGKWTQELRDSYEKGAKASEYFTSRKLIPKFLEKLQSIYECNSLSCVEIRCNEYREEYEEKLK